MLAVAKRIARQLHGVELIVDGRHNYFKRLFAELKLSQEISGLLHARCRQLGRCELDVLDSEANPLAA
jgi:hypothetical protein